MGFINNKKSSFLVSPLSTYRDKNHSSKRGILPSPVSSRLGRDPQVLASLTTTSRTLVPVDELVSTYCSGGGEGGLDAVVTSSSLMISKVDTQTAAALILPLLAYKIAAMINGQRLQWYLDASILFALVTFLTTIIK